MIQTLNNILIHLSAIFLSVNVLTIEANNTDYENNIPTKIVSDIEAEEIQENLVPVKKTTYTDTSQWWKYPSNIKIVSRNGNDLLVLVNKEYKLPSTFVPSGLVRVTDKVIRNGDKYYLRSILINDLKNLVATAKADGVDLSIISAYRSYATQTSTYNYWIQYNGGKTDAADKISARPGHSQHQLGTAIDFSSKEVSDNIGTRFNNTKASAWLQKNAYKYGFVISFPSGYERITGYSYESWHYRYIGIENALKMKNKGQILEIYLGGENL